MNKREIKFRIYIHSQKRMIDAIGFCYEGVSQIRIWYKKGELIFNESFLLVDTDSLQFTGLYDKNKTPIYEGDICAVNYYDLGMSNGVVVFRIIYSGYYLEGKNFQDSMCSWEPKFIEVIGNIYEHPNLLETTPTPITKDK